MSGSVETSESVSISLEYGAKEVQYEEADTTLAN
jgi:hypothetical protein